MMIFVSLLTTFNVSSNFWGVLIITWKWLESKPQTTIAKLCLSKSMIHTIFDFKSCSSCFLICLVDVCSDNENWCWIKVKYSQKQKHSFEYHYLEIKLEKLKRRRYKNATTFWNDSKEFIYFCPQIKSRVELFRG